MTCSASLATSRTDSTQLQRELHWASRRPSSSWPGDSPPGVQDDDAFEQTLTDCEMKFLRGYEEKTPNGICSLNQNPDVTCVATNKQAYVCQTPVSQTLITWFLEFGFMCHMRPHGQVMPTLVSSASLWYSQVHRRWLTVRELPVLQGIPVLPRFSYQRSCCSFAVRGRDADPQYDEWPSRQSVCRMSGNTMHVHVAGIVMLFVWSQVEMDPKLLKFIGELRQISSVEHHRVIKKLA